MHERKVLSERRVSAGGVETSDGALWVRDGYNRGKRSDWWNRNIDGDRGCSGVRGQIMENGNGSMVGCEQVGIVVVCSSQSSLARREAEERAEARATRKPCSTSLKFALRLLSSSSLLYKPDHQLKSSSLPSGSLQSTLMALATPMRRSRSTHHF